MATWDSSEFKDLDGTYLPTRERFLMGMGLVGKSSRMGPVFLAVLIVIVLAAIVSFIVTKTRTRAKKARIIKQQQSDTISYIDCTMPSSVLPMPMTSGSYCSAEADVSSVLGQSLSYSLSPQRYPYLAEYQGAELRSIHRHDSMMISSRISAKNHSST